MKLTLENLHELANKEDGPYLMKFSSSSCGPCRTMAPVIEAFKKDNPEISVYEVDVYESPELAEHFEVRSVPTLFVCEKREILYTFNGVTPKGDLEFVFDHINDPHFRETGQFNMAHKKNDKYFIAVVLVIVCLFIALFIF